MKPSDPGEGEREPNPQALSKRLFRPEETRIGALLFLLLWRVLGKHK
jgi:hypothetical protein